MSSPATLALRLKDFSDQTNVFLKHPVCFECFGEILKQQEYKVQSQEKERNKFKEQLDLIEKELKEAEGPGDQELLKELQDLEKEEKELDEKLSKLAKEEEQQNQSLKYLEKERDNIQKKEEEIWQKVNDYEKEHTQ